MVCCQFQACLHSSGFLLFRNHWHRVYLIGGMRCRSCLQRYTEEIGMPSFVSCLIQTACLPFVMMLYISIWRWVLHQSMAGFTSVIGRFYTSQRLVFHQSKAGFTSVKCGFYTSRRLVLQQSKAGFAPVKCGFYNSQRRVLLQSKSVHFLVLMDR